VESTVQRQPEINEKAEFSVISFYKVSLTNLD
jgi:hypothetical protein